MGTISSSTLLLILISIFRQHKRIEFVANTKIGGGYYFITSCLVLYTTNSNLNCIVRGTGRSKILRFFLLSVYSVFPFVVVVFLIDSYDGTGEGGILYISYISFPAALAEAAKFDGIDRAIHDDSVQGRCE